MKVPDNVIIARVERAGRLDRNGQPVLETVYARKRARLERSHAMLRGGDGVTIDIDGRLYTDDMEIRAQDLLTIDNAFDDKYTVFDVSEESAVNGREILRVCRLVKRRKP